MKSKRMNLLINILLPLLIFSGILNLIVTPVHAQYQFDDSLSSGDKQQIDEMMRPIHRIFDLVKYIYFAVAILMGMYGAILLATARGAQENINKAKMTFTSIILGGIVFYIAPTIIPYLLK